VKLRADVSGATGADGRRRAGYVEGRHVQPARPPTVHVEITEGPPGFSLIHLDANGDCVGDTWHPTLAEAMRQAKVELGVEETAWISISD
jgi:hypothetical protein